MEPIVKCIFFARDSIVTVLLWMYFIFGFIIFFMPLYILSLLVYPRREVLYQTLNCFFYRGFFLLARVIIPQFKIRIFEDVRRIHSSVVICNHRSYLDPLLMISLFPRHLTIVKGIFFKIPVFGWILRGAGYIPFFKEGQDNSKTYDRITRLSAFIKSGGNIFIFPEGTRSKNDRLGEFKSGAFRISKICKAPLALLYIENTDLIFQPGRFLFNTHISEPIRIRLLEIVFPDYNGHLFSLKDLSRRIIDRYKKEYAKTPRKG
jgi:1-acyl-sn-glycerol-3-phosphate acyltransferase